MRIVVAPDSFKGSLTAAEAAAAIACGFRAVLPDADIVSLPMADGGEGTVDALLGILGGHARTVTVRDPFDRPVAARYGWMPQARLAVVETAAASGLPLLAGDGPDPLRASSFGTGQLVRDALDRGAQAVILGLGGSATVDGGTGFLEALGVRFLDDAGRPLRAAGGTLGRIARIDSSGLDPRLRAAAVIAACDVTCPLLGPSGAVHVFGPQKGATPELLPALEAGMARYAEQVRALTGRDFADAAGGGAAGGLGFALRAFADAELRSGFSLIADFGRLADRIAGADLVVTGEGRLDAQSFHGKTPLGVARLARAAGVPVVAFAGRVDGDAAAFREEGIVAAHAIADATIPLERAMAEAAGLLERCARRAAEAVTGGTILR
ncbi:glycerate kinase [Azospirillum sp.]|uniref:glycerate kinase n=1 Tax=Azospirillum sp. TaxID=34012 RepID=UPI002D57C3A3|nr:glycerate kinase [Azospirillum sp.]HYD66502.1 glycerate kinase [Azospirillum sp.]